MDDPTLITPSKTGLIKRGKLGVKIIAGVLAIVAACGWISLGVGLFLLKMPQEVAIVVALVTAFATEGLIWAIAALMGLKVVEARKHIWHHLTGRKSTDKSKGAQQ